MNPSPGAARPRVLLFSTLYPSGVRPGHGIFVAARLQQVLASGAVDARVVAPVPWFYSTDSRHGDHALMARTARHERLEGVEVEHPRYLLPPKVGMHIAPFMLAAGALPTLKRLIRSGFDFDVIDAHYYYPDGVAAALLARHFDKPLVITARGSDLNLIARHAVPRRLMRWAASRADTSIAVSQALADTMASVGMAPSRIRVLCNGVDLASFSPQPQAQARRALGWPDVPTLIAVGNLVALKGQRLVIEALESLPDHRLVLVGSGPDEVALRSLAQQRGLAGRVQFCGRVEQRHLSAHYSAADMLVLPSEREGMPNVALESIACGTPVIATAVGGIPEIVDSPVVGRLMNKRSADGVAAAVREMCSQGIDREAVRRHAMRFGWDDTTRAQLDIFRRLAAVRRTLPKLTATGTTCH